MDQISSLLYLLWRNIVTGCPHVNLLVDVQAGDDEEDAGSSCPARQKTTQPEDDCSLVLLGKFVSNIVMKKIPIYSRNTFTVTQICICKD